MKNLIVIALFLFSSYAYALEIPPVNGIVTITSNGATARTQFPSRSVSGCTVQALSGNAGSVYIGGGTVTNASGVNQGIELEAGVALSNLTVSNSNMIFVAADTANDEVAYVCN